jgi:hypothetical protein
MGRHTVRPVAYRVSGTPFSLTLAGVAPQVAVYAWAINSSHTVELMDYRAMLPWKYRGNMQRCVNVKHDTGFAVYLLTADCT